jgi:predicted DNA-binding transcriptional regulator AlpA
MKAIPTNYDELPCVLSAKDLSTVLRISRASTYNLLHSKDFPTLAIGGRLMVTKENLLIWMNQNTNYPLNKPSRL